MAAHGRVSRIRVVVIASADALDQPWIAALRADASVDVRAVVGVMQHGIEVVRQEQPDVLLIDRSLVQAEQLLQAVASAVPQTMCIALLAEQDMPAVRRLAAAGARDLVIKPFAPRALQASVRQVLQRERPRHTMQPALLTQDTPASGGSVIVVFGVKGGVGTTTIATNLAVALRRITSRRVALADFSPQFGDVGVLLNLWSKQTLHDLAAQPDPLDDRLVDQALVAHRSGVDVLLGSDAPGLRAGLSDAQVRATVQALRARASYVLIDGGALLDRIGTTLLGLADQVLLVTTPEVPALKNTRQTLDYLTYQGLPCQRVALVLNRFPSVRGVTLHDIQQHVGHPVRANLPSDGPAVAYAINTGVPVLEQYPESWIAQSLLRLAASLAGDPIQTVTDAPASRLTRLARGRRRLSRWRLALRKATEQA